MRLLPPPEHLVPSLSRAEALRSGRAGVGLGGFGPALQGGVPPIVYLATLEEPSPGHPDWHNVVWIVEYPHTRFRSRSPVSLGNVRSSEFGVYALPYFLVVNPTTGQVHETFGGFVQVKASPVP
jgi:hypothetical protein